MNKMYHYVSLAVSLGAAVTAAACGGETPEGPNPCHSIGTAPRAEIELLRTIHIGQELDALLPRAEEPEGAEPETGDADDNSGGDETGDTPRHELVGITVAPDSGAVYVLESRGDIISLGNELVQESFEGEIELTHLASVEGFEYVPGSDTDEALRPETFTGIAFVDDGLFGLSARNDGLVADLDDERLLQRFCYEPGFAQPEPGDPQPDPLPGTDFPPEGEQISYALAYAPQEGRFYAQPETLGTDASGEEIAIAQHIASFDLETGTEQQWWELEEEQAYTGMALSPLKSEILLARDTELRAMARTDEGPVPARGGEILMLQGFGVEDVQGLAIYEPEQPMALSTPDQPARPQQLPASTLLVLDGAQNTIFVFSYTIDPGGDGCFVPMAE